MKTFVLLIVATFLMALPASADTLTFAGAADCANSTDGIGASQVCLNNDYINQAYGDTATVNVTYKDLTTGNSLQWWLGDYNDLTGVVWGGSGDAAGQSWNRIELLPDAGYSVMLSKFDMGAWYQSTMDTHLRILELGTDQVLLDYGIATIGDGSSTHSSFAPGISSKNGLAIEWRDSAYDVGIDNIEFSAEHSAQQRQTNAVPEPISLVLSAIGVSACALLKRKQS